MIEIKGNIWDYYNKPGYAIAITTNGTLKKDGTAVMGAGVAKQAKERFPELTWRLGKSIALGGNNFAYLVDNIFSFPVKHNWWEKADIELIKRSAKQLQQFLNANDLDIKVEQFVLVRPGTGNGRLDWEMEVKPAIKDILDDKILIVNNE